MKKAKLHILSHMHWDREWYQDFQGYRRRLVYQIDSLLELLEKKPEYACFHFDGQTACLLDYLAIRPENEERIKEHIKSGRIVIGPWFVMPDELLLSGESLVRNLLFGHKICRKFGTEPMPVGYVTDIFGHCSQFPQILKGFGIGCALFHRGTSGENEKSEMLWEGADGSRVLILKVYQKTGYCDFLTLKWYTAENLPDYAKEYEKNKLELATTDIIFALDGNDHATPRWDMTDEIARLNDAFENIEFIHSSFPKYYNELKTALGDEWQKNLIKFKGELRTPAKSGMWNEVFNGIGSSRLPLKQTNDEIERVLARYAEPLHVWSKILGGDCQKAFLELAWNHLLLNHPHDSIVGCSIDQVHRDMMYRFDQARSIAHDGINESVQHICAAMGFPPLEGCARGVNVFNLSGYEASPTLKFEIEIPCREADAMEKDGNTISLVDKDGNPVQIQILNVEKHTRSRYFVNKYKEPYPAYSVNPDFNIHKYELLVNSAISPMSRAVFGIRYVKALETGAASITVSESERVMENGFIRVNITEDGRLDIRDLQTGCVYNGLLCYEDCGDAGDGWSHFYPETDRKILSTDEKSWKIHKIKLTEKGALSASFEIDGTINVPEGIDSTGKERSGKTVGLRIKNVITINSGTKRLDCKTTVDNRAKCHRLRVMFATGLNSAYWYGDTAFDMVKRAVELPDTTGWKEQVRPESPIKNFAGIIGKASQSAADETANGLFVITKGLCEACVIDDPDRTLALTLFRGFEENLLEERTKESQLIGELTMEYAILPLSVDEVELSSLMFAETERYKFPLAAYSSCIGAESKIPQEFLLSVGAPFVLSTVKISEDGSGVAVRFFNPLEGEAISAVKAGFGYSEVWEANMLENKLCKIESDEGGNVYYKLHGKGIGTLLFKF